MITVSPEDAEKKFHSTEQCFRETESDIKASREFIAKHKDALSKFTDWTCYGWSGRELRINLLYSRQQSAKEIAKLFGAEGWRRKPNSHTCGAIDWMKDFDGFQVTIEGAENLKPKLIEEVKI